MFARDHNMVVKATRIRLLEGHRNMTTSTGAITVDLLRAVKWFTQFIHVYNGQSSYQHLVVSDEALIKLDTPL